MDATKEPLLDGTAPEAATGDDAVAAKTRRPSRVIDSCIDAIPHRRVWFLAMCLGLSNAADAVNINAIGYIMTELGDEISRSQKELLTAAVFMGMLAGGLSIGYLADFIGRKRALIYSLLLNVIAGFASAAAPNPTFLIGTRVFAGVGIGGSFPIIFSLGAEIFPAKERGKMISVVGSFYTVGATYVALIAWIMLGTDFHGKRIMPMCTWRWFAAATVLPSICALLCTMFFLQESPRYYAMKGKFDEATEVLSKLTGKIIDSNVFKRDVSTPLTPGDVEKGQDLNSNMGSRTSSNNTAGTLAIVFGRSLWRTTILLLLITCTLSFGSYGISTWISNLFEDVGISNAYATAFVFAFASWPGNIISVMYIESIGRKRLLAVTMTLAAMSAVGFAVDKGNAIVVVVCASLFNACSIAGWNSLDCLQAESFPTVVRTSGVGILSASARLSAMSAQFVNGALEANVSALLFVTSACMVSGGMSVWLLPDETTGMSLIEDDETLAETDLSSPLGSYASNTLDQHDDTHLPAVHDKYIAPEEA
jgi:MFS family permease